MVKRRQEYLQGWGKNQKWRGPTPPSLPNPSSVPMPGAPHIVMGHASPLGKYTESSKQDGLQERGLCRPQRCSGQFGQELQVLRHLRCGVEWGMGPGGHGDRALWWGSAGSELAVQGLVFLLRNLEKATSPLRNYSYTICKMGIIQLWY